MVRHPTLKEHVISGFWRAGGWLLGMAWLGLVFWGITEGFASERAFSEGRHPSRVLGYALLAAAAAIMVVTAEYWKRVFPGIMLGSNIQFPSRTLARPCCKQPFRGSFSLNSSDSLVGEHRSHSLGTDIQESQVNYARPRCALGFRCLTLLGSNRPAFCFNQAPRRGLLHSSSLGY